MKNIKPAAAFIDMSRAHALIEKWKPVLDYESKTVGPIEDEHTRLNTAILLENQETWCLKETNLSQDGGVFGATLQGTPGQGGAIGNADFYAQGDARLPKVLIPMIRRTFPELITNEIVGVQPMSGPVGLVFALRYRYDNTALIAGGTCNDSSASTAACTPVNNLGTTINNTEVGWNYLDSRFTGVSTSQLSGLGTGSDFTYQAEDAGVAALLANYEFRGNFPQLIISFEKTAVEAGTRRLSARWSIELEQDLKNMNGIDIDNELTNAMSYEIQAEIDREMIMRMVQVALNAGAGAGYSLWYAACADARWLGERTRDFYAKVIVEANRIAIRNRRGAANFCIATPRVCAMLEMLPEFKFMPMNSTVNTQPIGIAKVGTVGGRFTVYRDTRTDAQQYGNRTASGYFTNRSPGVEYCLLGYKGAEYYDTGIVYAPYIPVMIQRTIGPNDFSPRVGLLTRYGVVDNIFGANLYYHCIIVKGLGDSFVPGSAHTYL